MASYPRALDVVTLNGQKYAIDPQFGETTYVQSPQPQFVEQDRQVFWTSWTQRSFHNGERLPAILSKDDLEAFRYHDGEGVDVGMLSEWGEVRIQPTLTRSLAVQSATMPMAVSSDGTTLLVGLTASPYIKIWTSAAGWVSATTLVNTSAVTDLMAVGSTFYAVQGGVPITSTNAGVTWSALTGSHTGVVGLGYANGDVYLLKSGTGAGRVYNHTQAEDVSTITGSFIAGYRENIYWGADSRLYLYNGRSVTLYDQLPAGYIMTGLIPYRGILFILGYYKLRTGKRNAVYYLIQGTENHLFSVGDSTTTGIMQALAGSDDEVFFANPTRGGADRYDMTLGGVASGPATGTAMVIPFKSMAICEGYLWVGRYDGAVGTDGIYQSDVNVPSTYLGTGWFTTPAYDFDYPNERKLFRDIRIEHAALTIGQSITVHYSLDEGATWVQAMVSKAVGATSGTATLSNIKANTIKLKLTLASGASASTTPVLRKTVVRAAPVTEAKWMWQLKLLILGRFGGAALFTAIKAAYSAQAQLEYIDVDESTANVIISDCQIVRKPSKEDDYGYVVVELREV